MVNPLRLEGKVKDISIELNDSCNCCCFKRAQEPKPDTQVYITSDVVAVNFMRTSRTSYNVSIKRSVAHLTTHIAKIANQYNLNSQHAIEEISKIANVSLDENEPAQLSLAMVKRINLAMKSVFR